MTAIEAVGSDPREPVVLPDGSAVYVPIHDSNSVAVIDPVKAPGPP